MEIKGFYKFNNGGGCIIHRKDSTDNTTLILSTNGEELTSKNVTVNALIFDTTEEGTANLTLDILEFDNVNEAEKYFEGVR